jgi:hypothetical protein
LWNLIHWLPTDSPLHRDFDPEGAGSGWTPTTNLLALIAEVTDVSNVILMKVYGEKGVKVRDPIEIPRPGRTPKVALDEEGKPIMAGSEQLKAFTQDGGNVVPRRG